MESIFLKNYLENVGDAIHCLNTICVGLANVGDGIVEKPDDLVITWNPHDKSVSSMKSRMYAVKSTYVFLAESTYQYIDSIKNIIIPSDKSIKYDAMSNAEKVEEVFNIACKSEPAYRTIMLKLMIHTRNRVVHKRSKASLSSKELDILKLNKDEINIKFSDLDILETISHFEKNDFTLKDVSSHAANNIYMIRKLDDYFVTNIKNIQMIETIIKQYDVEDEWNNIKNMEESEAKDRKLHYFFNVYFKFLNDDIANKFIEELA